MQDYKPEKIIYCKASEIASYLPGFNQIILVGNFLKPVISGAKTISIPDGENAKTMDVVNILWDMFSRYDVDDRSVVISMGGGSASDVVGFAAANYKRGVPFASIPTTLLSMVDASVGAKRAINFNGAKNLVGCFYPAQIIFICSEFLESLNQAELQNGYVEAIKLSLISGFDLSKNPEDMVKQCIDAKQKIVAKDPFDKLGIRMSLNFGHTLGHALEALSKFDISHGIAVATGMDFSAALTNNTKVQNLIRGQLQEFGVMDSVNEVKASLNAEDIDSIMQFVSKDKKLIDGKLGFVVLENFGKPAVLQITLEEIKSSLLKYIS